MGQAVTTGTGKTIPGASQVNSSNSDRFAEMGGPGSVRPTAREKRTIDGPKLAGKKLSAQGGLVDFRDGAGEGDLDACIGGAWTEIEVANDTGARLGPGSDDGLKRWLEGGDDRGPMGAAAEPAGRRGGAAAVEAGEGSIPAEDAKHERAVEFYGPAAGARNLRRPSRCFPKTRSAPDPRPAALFHPLHAAGRLLVPNVSDAGGARPAESPGAKAVVTTSAGVAWSHGYAEGGGCRWPPRWRRS